MIYLQYSPKNHGTSKPGRDWRSKRTRSPNRVIHPFFCGRVQSLILREVYTQRPTTLGVIWDGFQSCTGSDPTKSPGVYEGSRHHFLVFSFLLPADIWLKQKHSNDQSTCGYGWKKASRLFFAKQFWDDGERQNMQNKCQRYHTFCANFMMTLSTGWIFPLHGGV